MNDIRAKKLSLINIINAQKINQEKIRTIRNEEQVRKWMYTDHEISAEEHQKWLNRLETDTKNIVFVVFNEEDEPLGVVSINSIDQNNKKADWAYYLTATARSGIGAVLEFNILNYIFSVLGLEKLNCEVIENNEAVVRLHEKFGFKREGFREENIIKNGERLGVHYLGLTKGNWLSIREVVSSKYSKIFTQYNFVIA